MKASIRDKTVLLSVDLMNLTDYLNATDWHLLATQSSTRRLFIKQSVEKDSEILLPDSSKMDDYPTRISQALYTLEQVEDRSQLDILRDISNVRTDVIRLRAPEVESTRHSTKFRYGVTLLDHAMEMIAAAANSTIAPRRVQPNRKPPAVEDYMRWLELGPSEKGSYVITILSRVEPMLTQNVQPILEVIETPFPRRVTRTLSTALKGVKDAAAEFTLQKNFQPFLDNVENGVSANLCESIAAILRESTDLKHLDLNIHWALKSPEKEAEIDFEFSRQECDILSDAAKILRESAPTEGIPVTGVVINLHREEGATDGISTIACVVGGKVVKLHVPLSATDYELAIESHKSKKAVLFRTDVLLEGRTYIAKNVSDFRIID